MANYNINVKAKVDVQQIKSSIRQSLAETTIRVAPKFDVFADDNNIAEFRKAVARILNAEPISITLAEPTNDNISKILGEINKKFIITPTLKFDTNKSSEFKTQLDDIKKAIDDFGKSSKAKISFDVDSESHNQLLKIIDNINQKQNIEVGFSYNEQQVQKLSDLFHDLEGGIKELDKGAIEISFAPISDTHLVPIKTKIDDYFKNNPITLTIAETTGGIDLKSLIESFQEYQKTIKAITVDGLENQRASLRIQANDLKEYYNGNFISAQEYRDKLKALLEDQQNDAILSAKGSAKTREDLARELSRIEVQIANQTKAEQERIQQETADNWKKSIDNAFESLQSGGSFKKFQKELESLKDQGLQLNISGAQEYYDKVLQDGTEYITNLKEQNKQIGTMKGEITRLFNLVSEGKSNISEWDEKIEKWQSKPIFQTEQVQEHFTKLSDIIDAQYEAMIEKQKKAQEEAEKEIELLQEQIHLRSEIRSSMFEDVDSGINTQQQALDEKKQEFENYLNSLETVQKHTIETTKVLEKSFNEDIQNIFRNYQRYTTDFEAFNDDFWKRVKQASEQGISEETIQKAEDKWNKIADAHQKSVDKINQQQEKANQKSEQERQKEEQRIIKYLEDTRNKILKEQQEEEKQREQAWNKETQDLQEKYNKQLISTEEYIEKMEILVKQGFDNGYDKANHYSNSLEQVKKKQNEAGQSADNLGNKVNNLSSKFDNVFKSLMRYFGVTKIFDAVQNSFSKMIQEVRDLDVELTEFSKVTDLTSEQTNKFIDDAYRLGETVARTGTEVVQATTLFKKMGYEIDESMQFAKDALMWTNVADGMVTAENAATMLISTMKAFEEQGLSSTHVIDALNEVSNNYSTSSSALSDNLSTIAATLAVSGTSFEQTVGLMTAGIEIMPDKASKVANGLKTISQRIRQIDGDTADKLDEFLGEHGLSRFDEITGELKGTYDILEEISGIWDELSVNQRQYIGEVMAGKNQITVLNALMMNFSTAINATETAMNSAGSAARENERVLDSIQGHIQRFQSAFEELSHNLINSEVFKQVVDFGTNLIKIFNSLTDETWKLIAVFTGAGITGIVGVIQKFNNGFQEAQKKVESFNKALEKAQKKGEKLDEVFKNIDKGQYFDSLVSKINVATASIGLFIAALTTMIQIRDNIEAEEERRWQDEFNNRNKEINKINELKTLEEEYLKSTDPEKRKLLYEKIHNIKVEIANLDIDGLSRTELLSGEIGKQNELYNNQLAKISSINLQLIKQKQIIEANEHEGLGGIFKHLPGSGKTTPVELNDESIKQQYLFNQDYDNFINNASISIQNKIDNLQQLQAYLADMVSNYDPGTPYYEMYMKLFEYVKEDIKELQGMNDEITSLTKEQAETILGDLSSYTEEQLESMAQLFDAISTGSIEDMSKAILELQDIFGEDLKDNFLQKIRENLSDPDLAQAAYDLIDTFLTLKNATEDTTYSYSEAMGEMLSILTESTNLVQQQYDILTQAVDEFAESGVITKETLQSLTENDLLQYLDLVDGQLVLNTEDFRRNEEAIMNNASAQIDNKLEAELLALANSKLTESLDNIPSATNSASEGIASTTNTATEATVAILEDTAAIGEMEQAYASLGKVIGKEINARNFDLQGYLDEAAELINKANQLKQNLTNFNYVASRGSSSSRSSGSSGRSSSSGTSASRSSSSSSSRSSTSSSRSSEDLWKKEFEKQQKILKHYLEMEEITERQYYASLKILNDQFFKDRVEYEEEYLKYQEEIYKGEKKFVQRIFERTEDILENQLEASMITSKEYFDKLESLYTSYYTKQEDLEDRLFELKKQRYQYEKQQIQDQINLMESQMSKLLQRGEGLLKHRLAMDEITQTQYLDALEALYLSYYEDREELEEKLWEVEEGRYEERKEKLDTVISYAISVIDEEIDKLKKEKESIDEVNDSIEEQIKLQELQDNLEKARNRKIRVYRKGQGFVYEQDTQAISEAQTALDEYKRELSHKKKISMIDEEIENLEKYKEKWQSITDNYTKSQNEMVVKGILGENARQKILEDEKSYAESLGNQYVDTKDKVSDAQTGMTSDVQEGLSAREELYTTEKLIVDSIGDKYWETRGKAKDANDAIITDLGLFIGSEDDPNSLSGKIKIINDELAKVGNATITVGIDGNKYIQTVQSIEDLGLVIDGLRGKEYTELTIDINGTEYELSKQEIKVIHDAIDNLQGKTLIIKIDDQTKESLSDIQHTVDSLEGKILQIGIQNNISDDDITAIQALLNKLKNKVIEVSLQDTISDTELEDIQNDINALQGKLIEVGIDSGTYKDDLNTIQNAIDEMTGKALPIDINDQTQTPLSDIQTALDALKDANIEVKTNDIQTILDDLEQTKNDIEALNGSKAELEIGWKEENNKTQLEILQDSLSSWQSSYSTYLNEIIDKLRTLIESQKQAGSYDVVAYDDNTKYTSTYSYVPQIGDKVSVTREFQQSHPNWGYLNQPQWVIGQNASGEWITSLEGPNGNASYAIPSSALYKYGTSEPTTLSYNSNISSNNSSTESSSSGSSGNSSGGENYGTPTISSYNGFTVGQTVINRRWFQWAGQPGQYGYASVKIVGFDGNGNVDIQNSSGNIGTVPITDIHTDDPGDPANFTGWGSANGQSGIVYNNPDSGNQGSSQQESTETKSFENRAQVRLTQEGKNYIKQKYNAAQWALDDTYTVYSTQNGLINIIGSGYDYAVQNVRYQIDPKYLEAAATGTLGTKSNVFMVNEAGIEAMVTPEGTVVSAPTPGYGVIKNEYTERLTDFAADPLQFLNKEFSGYVGNYKNNQNNNQVININGDLNLPNVTNGESFVDSIKTLALQYTTRRK